MKSKLYIFLMLLIIGCTSIIENNFSEKSKIDIERLNLIEKLITKDIKKNNLPGAVVLVGDEKGVVYQKAFGIKNPDTKERYTTDDIFRIASMTKAITSLGVIKLWEKGKIGLDDPIEKYIPEFKNVEILNSFNKKDTTYSTVKASNKITIRQLLTHTSGIGYDFIPDVLNNEIIDEYIKVNDQDSFITARRVIKEECFFIGGASGSAIWAGLKAAEKLSKGQNCLILLPDSIRNYLSGFVNDEWLKENGFCD